MYGYSLMTGMQLVTLRDRAHLHVYFNGHRHWGVCNTLHMCSNAASAVIYVLIGIWGHHFCDMQTLKIPLVAPRLGGVESLITRPATTTHVGMPQEERQVSFTETYSSHD